MTKPATVRVEYELHTFECISCGEQWEGNLAELTAPIELPVMREDVLKGYAFCSLLCHWDDPDPDIPHRKVYVLQSQQGKTKREPPWKRKDGGLG